jgi:hypothetical protein
VRSSEVLDVRRQHERRGASVRKTFGFPRPVGQLAMAASRSSRPRRHRKSTFPPHPIAAGPGLWAKVRSLFPKPASDIVSRHRAKWFAVLTFLVACGTEGCGPISSPVREDCDSLSSEPSWTIRPRGPADLGGQSDAIDLMVGQSRGVSVWPLVATECLASLTIDWRVANTEVASVLPEVPPSNSAWLTGLSPGSTSVTTRIRFSDGAVSETPLAIVEVSPPEGPPSGSTVIAEGETDLEPSPGDGVTPADFRRFVPFTTRVEGRIHFVVDWISPLNKINYVLTEGHCNSPGGCGTFIFSSNDDWIKPVEKSTDQPPGPYTLRIDNIGPGPETVRYEVRIIPK